MKDKKSLMKRNKWRRINKIEGNRKLEKIGKNKSEEPALEMT